MTDLIIRIDPEAAGDCPCGCPACTGCSPTCGFEGCLDDAQVCCGDATENDDSCLPVCAGSDGACECAAIQRAKAALPPIGCGGSL